MHVFSYQYNVKHGSMRNSKAIYKSDKMWESCYLKGTQQKEANLEGHRIPKPFSFPKLKLKSTSLSKPLTNIKTMLTTLESQPHIFKLL